MSAQERPTALITGASSGIGYELAKLFAAAGFDLALVARRREPLDRLANELPPRHGIRTRVMVEDLADPAAPRRIHQALVGANVTVEALVNNAGFGLRGAFAELPLERQLALLQVNVTALTELSRLFLPGMVARGRGRVLNLASTAAFQPGPFMAVYYASKAYVLSLSEALAEELAGSGVTVTCLAPGPTATGFAEAAGNADSRLFRLGTMDAAQVARIGFEAAMAGRRLAVPGLRNWLAVQGLRLSPRALTLKLVRYLQG
jgi:hypothetical protein